MPIQNDPERFTAQPINRYLREFRTDLPSPNMAAVQKFADSLSSYGEMQGKAEADQAIKDALAAAPAKDENGNYMVAPAPDAFGPYAKKQFDDAIETRYKNNVFQDFQTKLNEIAANNQDNPSGARSQMEGHMVGTLKGMDPRIAKDLESNLLREVNERHRGILNLTASRQREAAVGDLRVQREGLLSQAQDAYSRGLANEAQRLEAEAGVITQRLVGLNAESALNVQQIQDIQNGNRKSGEILAAMNKAIEDGTITAEQLNFLHMASQGMGGNSKVTIGGLTISGNDVLDSIKDPRIRTILGNRIRSTYGDLLPNFERNDAAAASGAVNAMADRGISGFPLNTSKADQTRAVQSWIADQRGKGNNIDPTTPEGYNIIFQRYGAVPDELYKKFFDGVQAKSPSELEVLRGLYQAMDETVTRSGTRRSMTGILSEKDDAYMYWYSLARGGTGAAKGMDPTAAAEYAAKAVERGLTEFRGQRPENFVYQSFKDSRGNFATDDQARTKINGEAGVDVGKMSDEARRYLMGSIGLFAATGMTFDDAVKRGVIHFQTNFEANKYTLEFAQRGKNGITSKGLNPPELVDGDGRASHDYLDPLVKFAIKEMADPKQPHFKTPIDQLEVGKNLYMKSVGADPNNPSFQLWYYEAGAAPAPLLDKNGRIVTMFMGNYIKAQSSAAGESAITREQENRARIGEMNTGGPLDAESMTRGQQTGEVPQAKARPALATPTEDFMLGEGIIGGPLQSRSWVSPRPEHVMPPKIIREMLERGQTPLTPDTLNKGRAPRNTPLGQRTGSLETGDATVQPASFGGSAREAARNVIESASNWLGIHEQSGRQALSAFFKKTIGEAVDPVQTAWCAVFVNAVLRESGYSGTTGSQAKMARSFLAYGETPNKPSEGDIVVLQRGSDQRTGHVGFFMGYESRGGQQYVKVLGGNQGNSVNVTTFPASMVLGIRRPMKLDRMADLPGMEGTTFAQWNNQTEDNA